MTDTVSAPSKRAGGRFAPGNPGGPGRPARATEGAYLRAISEACPPDTWREIVGRAVRDARDGDHRARGWLASYLVGQPAHPAGTLSELAVQELLGTDPVEQQAAQRGRLAELERRLLGLPAPSGRGTMGHHSPPDG
jgi:hypothetical protein